MFIRTRNAVYAAETGAGAGSGEGGDKTEDKTEVKAEDKTEEKTEQKSDLPQTLEEAVKELQELRTAKGQVPKWAQDRIDTITRNWRETERERDALRGQVEQLKAAKPTTKVGFTQEEVEAKATQLAAERAFLEATNKVLADGRKANPNFDSALQALHNISPVMVQTPQGAVANMPQSFVEAVIELDKPSEVLSALALPANHDEAARIMALPPSRQGVALARFQAGLKPEVEVSKTPAPGTTVVAGRARASVDEYSAGKISTAEWMELRNKQIKERGQRRA